MSIFEILFAFLIEPIKMIFEFIFTGAFKMTGSSGISIMILSVIMNILLLPMYHRTDAIQQTAIQKEKEIRPEASHIRKTFQGNEKFMLLQTCYRQHDYKPLDSLKGISPLLLEIPFFMAAYYYLSELTFQEGGSFLNINNLGAPDEMLFIGGQFVNLLPLLMTLINILSCSIYTKDAPIRMKVQLYGMAVLFLVILYDSPSGLVLYWTLNNLFSLIKGILERSKSGPQNDVVNIDQKGRQNSVSATNIWGVFLAGILLTVLYGLLIPSSVISASPAEFADIHSLHPLMNTFYTFSVSAGLFLIWIPVFFFLSGAGGKKRLAVGMEILAIASLVNYMFFGTAYGTLTPALTYVKPLVVEKKFLNLLILLAIFSVVLYLSCKFPKILLYSCSVMTIAMLLMSASNCIEIERGYQKTMSLLHSSGMSQDGKIIPINRNGKNVVVLMMDRAISGYVPYMMEEKPELKRQFAGFTFYPNTVSFGPCTNVGTPPLYAGYEYTPEKINSRKDEPLVEKQNEALKVMPVLFLQNDFQVTVGDPSYAGYQWIADLSIYDEYPGITAFHSADYISENVFSQKLSTMWKEKGRQFLFYSIFRGSPAVLQPYIYDNGNYLYMERRTTEAFNLKEQIQDGNMKAQGISPGLYKAYSVLERLEKMTRIQESSQNTFLMMSNDTPHEPILLQEPEYVPRMKVDNTEYERTCGKRMDADGNILRMETTDQFMHYQVNMAAMLQLGQWFDFLRDNGVFDNTRIIIVSDHGNDMGQDDRLIWGEESYQDAMACNPVLMVKDFDCSEFKTDNTFMTNADVPVLAMRELIQDPVNPFTGNPINSEAKKEPVHILFTKWNVNVNNGNTFLEGPWISVHDDIWNKNNWEDISKEKNAG